MGWRREIGKRKVENDCCTCIARSTANEQSERWANKALCLTERLGTLTVEYSQSFEEENGTFFNAMQIDGEMYNMARETVGGDLQSGSLLLPPRRGLFSTLTGVFLSGRCEPDNNCILCNCCRVIYTFSPQQPGRVWQMDMWRKRAMEQLATEPTHTHTRTRTYTRVCSVGSLETVCCQPMK